MSKKENFILKSSFFLEFLYKYIFSFIIKKGVNRRLNLFFYANGSANVCNFS